MITLSQQFGIDLKCKKEAYALLMKLDQRVGKEKKAMEAQSINNEISIVPKEARNLIFDMNFKDGEPRS